MQILNIEKNTIDKDKNLLLEKKVFDCLTAIIEKLPKMQNIQISLNDKKEICINIGEYKCFYNDCFEHLTISFDLFEGDNIEYRNKYGFYNFISIHSKNDKINESETIEAQKIKEVFAKYGIKFNKFSSVDFCKFLPNDINKSLELIENFIIKFYNDLFKIVSELSEKYKNENTLIMY